MTKRTLLTQKQQAAFLNDNWRFRTLTHKWSSRGYGNSKILDSQDNIIGKAGGCGYDRYGAALANAISEMFPNEILKLAKRVCKNGERREYKQSPDFYGLFYNAKTKKAWLDGACGASCIERVLNKIGFSLEFIGESKQSSNGEVFYTLKPISKHQRQFLR